MGWKPKGPVCTLYARGPAGSFDNFSCNVPSQPLRCAPNPPVSDACHMHYTVPCTSSSSSRRRTKMRTKRRTQRTRRGVARRGGGLPGRVLPSGAPVVGGVGRKRSKTKITGTAP